MGALKKPLLRIKLPDFVQKILPGSNFLFTNCYDLTWIRGISAAKKTK